MRTILNFEIGSLETGSGTPAAEPPKVSRPDDAPLLFQSVVSRPSSASSGRWARSLAIALALHVILVAGFASAGTVVRIPAEPTEPEIVFYSVQPPPPPPAPVARSVPMRQARRVPRKELVIPQKVQRIEETPKAVEPEPEPVEEEVVAGAQPDTEPIAGGVIGGVLGGVAGGVVGGTVGGTVGATLSEPLELSQVLQAPKILKSVRPDYPRSARLARVEGVVMVRLVVGTDGRVEQGKAQILRSVPGLDSAALEAAEQFRFAPAVGRDGRPARVFVTLPLSFKLR